MPGDSVVVTCGRIDVVGGTAGSGVEHVGNSKFCFCNKSAASLSISSVLVVLCTLDFGFRFNLPLPKLKMWPIH